MKNLAYGLAGLLFIVVSFYEWPIAIFLRSLDSNQSIHAFNKICEQSIFEGRGLGVTDLPTVCALVAVFGYFWSKKLKVKVFLGGLSSVAVFTALGLVHFPKWGFGRVRPYKVVDVNSDLFSRWFTSGKHLLWGEHGVVTTYSGSFPSGHTASMVALLAFVWLMNRSAYRKFCFCIILISSLLMACSRVSIGAHWPTDTGASLFLVSVCSYAVLKFSHMSRHRMQYPELERFLPRFFDVKVCGYLCLQSFLLFLGLLTMRHFFAYGQIQYLFWGGSSTLAALTTYWRYRVFHKDAFNVHSQHKARLTLSRGGQDFCSH